MSKVDVSVVIPAWNTRDLLRAALVSLRNAGEPVLEVTVVDNASRDGSAEMVAREFPEVRLLENRENRGFSAACNQGLTGARGRHLLLLNSDAEVAPDAIRALCQFLDAHPDYGAAAPRLVNSDGTTQRGCMRFPNWKTALFFATPLQRWRPRSRELVRYFHRDFDHEGDRDVEQPPAACLLLRRTALERVGALDEHLWLFFSDVDLCLRLSQSGYKVRYVAAASVRHHLGQSTAQFPGFVAEWHRNRLAYYRKHHGRLAGAWVKACVLWTGLDYSSRQAGRRLFGACGEPVQPFLRELASFLRS